MYESKFTGGVLGLIGINLATFFLILFTLGLGTPWAVCYKQKWVIKHTVIDGRQLKFVGKGIALFGNFIKWYLLVIITLGIFLLWLPVKFQQWKTKHTHVM